MWYSICVLRSSSPFHAPDHNLCDKCPCQYLTTNPATTVKCCYLFDSFYFVLVFSEPSPPVSQMGCVYSNASSKNQFQSDEQLEDAQPSRCRIFNVSPSRFFSNSWCNHPFSLSLLRRCAMSMTKETRFKMEESKLPILNWYFICGIATLSSGLWGEMCVWFFDFLNFASVGFCVNMAMTTICLALNAADGVQLVQVTPVCAWLANQNWHSSSTGIYAFKCSNAMHLFQTLVDVINNATLTSSATALNVGAASNAQNSHVIPLQNSGSSSHSPTNNMVHEYQNLAPFGDNGTLRSTGGTGVDANFRSHSAIGNDHHTYLNSSNNNVIGIKSQPNYYTSKPLSFNSNSHFEGSRNSLSSGPRSAGLVNNFDSSTLPMRSPNSSICNGTQDDTCLGRRKNSEYENTSSYVNTYNNVEPMRSRMAGSEDFCFVNIDPDSRREKIAFHGKLISLLANL